MSDGKQEVQVQHKWLWAISPLTPSSVAFVAHCRQCNNTFTQSLVVSMNGFSLSSVALPEWGCKVPPSSEMNWIPSRL